MKKIKIIIQRDAFSLRFGPYNFENWTYSEHWPPLPPIDFECPARIRICNPVIIIYTSHSAN